MLALQKWNGDRVDPIHVLPSITLRVDSQDAWVFQPPMSQAVIDKTNFFLGQPKCDNRLTYILKIDGNYQVSDPAFAVRAIEFPYISPVVYDNAEGVLGNAMDLLLSDEFVF